MKKTILLIFCVILICSIIFAGLIFFTTKTEKLIGVETKKENVPYTAKEDFPTTTTLLIEFEDGWGAAIKLDFENIFISAVILENPTLIEAEKFGYFPNETIYCDYSFLLEFTDILGGLNLNIFGEKLRYTGVQVCNILAVNNGSIKTKREVLCGIFEKINKNGFSSEALSCIINKTKTSLNTPKCFGWNEYIQKMCGSYNIVNEG